MATGTNAVDLHGKAEIAAALGRGDVWLWRHLRKGGPLSSVIIVEGEGRGARYSANRARLLKAWAKIQKEATRTVAAARKSATR